MVIYIKPIETCNLKCLHCYNDPVSYQLNFSKAKKFLRDIEKYTHDNHFVLHGGEPLLAPSDKVINLIKSFPKVNWRITTNLCMELTDKRLDILEMMSEVRTSFDIGIRFGNIHNLLLWRSNVKKLRKLGINVYLNVCLSQNLIHKNPLQLLRMLASLDISTLSFERITTSGAAAKNNYLIPSYEEIDAWLCELYSAAKSFPEIRIRTIEDVIFGLRKDRINCRADACCKSTMTINANGTVGTCPNDAQDNVFGSIWQSAKDLLLIKTSTTCHIKKECLACEKFEHCFGGCAQLEWQGNTCPYPHRLAEIIKEDMNL